MVSRFIRKLRSVFHRQPADRSHSNCTINGVFGDWETSTIEDLLPPYSDIPESKTQFSQDEKHSPPRQSTSTHIQICPHETLSFQGLQDIINSLATKTAGQAINALTLSCQEHCDQVDPSTKDAKPVCVSPSLLRGFGTYALEDREDSPDSLSVMLCFHWDLGSLDGVGGQVETALELQHFLGADGIWLCPHKAINDSDILNAIYDFVRRRSSLEVNTGCDHCDTEITVYPTMEGIHETCHVTTRRHLGTMEKSDDPMWLTQCV